MTIAITGATGQLGRLTVAATKALGAAPVALVRSPEKAADLGVEARAFDYETPDQAALKGVDTLVLISSNEVGKRFPQHKAVIEAAKAAGVKRIIYTSLLKGDASPMKLADEHIATEAALKASGLAYTILRNGWYAYTPSIPFTDRLPLTRSEFTADFTLCADGQCHLMAHWLPSDGGVTYLTPCSR